MITLKPYLGILAAALFLGSCSKEAHEDMRLKHSDPNAVKISVSASFGDTGFETGSEIVPMSTRNGERIAFELYPIYDCIIMKDVEGTWIIDQLLQPVFRQEWVEGKTNLTSMPVKADAVSEPFDLELRPGKYKMLVVFNADGAAFNKTLYEGMVLDEANLPYAVKYKIPAPDAGKEDNSYANAGHHLAYDEIFTAFTDFEVTKSDSLAQDKFPRELKLTADRRVAKFRVIAKSLPTGTGIPDNSLLLMSYTLRGTDPAKPFCEGVDLFNKPWYSDEGLTTIEVVQTFISHRSIVVDGRWYVLPTAPARTYNPYYFIDPDDKAGVPIEFGDFEMTGPQGYPPMICLDRQNSILINNEITGVIMEEIEFDPTNNCFWFGMLSTTPQEAKALFPDDYEFNVN